MDVLKCRAMQISHSLILFRRICYLNEMETVKGIRLLREANLIT